MRKHALILGLFLLPLLVGQPAFGAAQILVFNLDAGTGLGLDDPTPVAPVGLNPGTTLGEQRLNVFIRAADIWGGLLNSNVPTVVLATFTPLNCGPGFATLGSAGAITVHRDFTGAVFPLTWYHAALANSLAGVDLNGPDTAEIFAQFNRSIDNNPNCLTGINWYYGLDANPPGGDIDFLTVILHEMGHGLGFSSFVNEVNGQLLAGFHDVWNHFLFDLTQGRLWVNMTAAQRAASAINTGNLVWSGANVTAQAGTLTAGVNHGFVQMYAPNPVRPGSSVSHWDIVVTPNELMEPDFTNLTRDVGLAFELFQDIAWTMTPAGYTMFRPIPGVAGGNNLFASSGGVPGATTFLIFGFAGGSTAIPGCPGVFSGISAPQILASGPTDANGNFNFTFNVGGGAAGATVLFEAVELPSCLISNLVTETF